MESAAYGMLVNLMVDHDWEKAAGSRLVLAAWQAIKLPVCLGGLELDSTDPLEDVLKVTMENQELNIRRIGNKEMMQGYHGVRDLSGIRRKHSGSDN